MRQKISIAFLLSLLLGSASAWALSVDIPSDCKRSFRQKADLGNDVFAAELEKVIASNIGVYRVIYRVKGSTHISEHIILIDPTFRYNATGYLSQDSQETLLVVATKHSVESFKNHYYSDRLKEYKLPVYITNVCMGCMSISKTKRQTLEEIVSEALQKE